MGCGASHEVVQKIPSENESKPEVTSSSSKVVLEGTLSGGSLLSNDDSQERASKKPSTLMDRRICQSPSRGNTFGSLSRNASMNSMPSPMELEINVPRNSFSRYEEEMVRVNSTDLLDEDEMPICRSHSERAISKTSLLGDDTAEYTTMSLGLGLSSFKKPGRPSVLDDFGLAKPNTPENETSVLDDFALGTSQSMKDFGAPAQRLTSIVQGDMKSLKKKWAKRRTTVDAVHKINENYDDNPTFDMVQKIKSEDKDFKQTDVKAAVALPQSIDSDPDLNDNTTVDASAVHAPKAESNLHTIQGLSKDEPKLLEPHLLKDNTLIVFDWDDTIFPTTWVKNQDKDEMHWSKPCPDEDRFKVPLAHLSDCVKDLLEVACSLGTVAIVTLAQSPWVDTAIRNFTPELDQFLKDNDIKILYARDVVHPKLIWEPAVRCQSITHTRDCRELYEFHTILKRKAMSRVVHKFINKEKGLLHVISIGDSAVERSAAQELQFFKATQTDVASFRAKTVKMIDDPGIEELSAQVKLIRNWLDRIVCLDNDFDIELGDTNGAIYELDRLLGRISSFESPNDPESPTSSRNGAAKKSPKQTTQTGS